MPHDLRPLLILLALLVLFTLAVFGVSLYVLAPGTPTGPTITPVRPITIPPPPRTKANTTAALGKQATFNMLVSYVDTGFEPKTANIKIGETIRFVNNSTDGLNLCGDAFTSCKDLKPGEYWEFNFATVGTWTFENKSNPKYYSSQFQRLRSQVRRPTQLRAQMRAHTPLPFPHTERSLLKYSEALPNRQFSNVLTME